MLKLDVAAQLRCGVAPFILAAALVSPSIAVAQDAPQESQEAQGAGFGDQVIVVTGTRIARPDLESSSPVSVVSQESIKLAGKPGVEEFLRDIPQAVAAIGSGTNNGNPGAATVDLRNLGEERTLVLVDGKRFVPYDYDGIVDLNMIPQALVERVEVVTGGASAVYGSDAIAGVVNFVMKKDFQGIQADAQYGISEEGDGQTYVLSLTGGTNFADGRGNITVSGSYSKQKAVYQGARKFSEEALASSDFSPGGSFTNAPGFLDLGPDGYQFTASGDLVDMGTNPGAFQPFNFNPFNLLQSPFEKYTATAIARYELTDTVEFFGRGSYGKSKVTTIIAPTGTFFFPFDINYSVNPFLSNQAKSIIATYDTDSDGIVTAGIGRRLTELGTRDSVYENEAWQIVGGFRGEFSPTLNWEVFAQYGKTNRTQDFLNDVAFDRAQQAVLAVPGPACSDPSNGCVPANIFGPGNLTDAAADFIRLDLHEDNSTTQMVAGGFVSGDLPFSVPMASKPGAFVVGIEYRKETAEANPDINLVQGNSIGFGSSTPIDAEFRVWELYSEVKLPIVSDVPFVEELNLEGGVRYADYKNKVNSLGVGNSFTNWSWKIGGDWKPVESLRFRAMYQRAVRAPNIGEIGQPQTPSTGDAQVDPCQGSLPVGDAALTALCIATGVPAANIGSVGGPISGQINNYVGGNPNLVPEKSTTITVGAVFDPEFLPGFTATVDYFDIKVDKAIVQVPEQAILDACYTIEMDANGTYCSLIFRNPLNGRLIGGTETGVDAAVRNVGFLRARGIDVSASYKFDMGNAGNLGVGINLTRQLKSDLQFASFLPVNHCVGLVGNTCLRPDPKWRWTQTTTWTKGPVTLQLAWQHLGKLTQDTVAFGDALPSDFVVPQIKAYDYFDLSGIVDITDNFSLRGGISNLFDKQPPVVGNDYGGTAENSGNTYPATYDVLGRSFFIGATVKF
ncbi:MAG: TonB-dependent receptor [Sphingobium sp.]